MKKNLLLITIFIAIAAGGALLEGVGRFETAVRGLRNRELPSPLLNFGRRGQILKEMGLRYVVPAADEKADNGATRISLDLSKLDSRDEWFEADALPPEKMASTVIMDKSVVSTGLPVISMYMNEHDLYDKYTGIYANPLERGRNWERPCFVSYFKNGELLFGSGAGARIHGGTSRLHQLKSFRLYFRSLYGKDRFPEDLIFGGMGDPVQHVIVRKADEQYGFVNSMAYKIARRAGCYAPLTEPVRLYLNGKPHGHGNFEMIEHLKMDYLETHFGHRNFVYYKVKGRKNRPPEFQRLYEWARFSGEKFTLQNVSEVIDIENFINTWIVNIFCGNSDPYQGIALLDKSKSDSRWFWLMWDMDHSFKNIYEPEKKHTWEKERPLNLVYSNTKKETDPRYFIFRELIFNDESFRTLFRKRMEEKLNYVLTADFLSSVVDENSRAARSFGMNMTSTDQELHEYMNKRPEYVMMMLNRFFNLGEVKRVSIRARVLSPVLADGFNISGDFNGLYFQGSEISLSGKNSAVKGWIVNGKRYNSSAFTLRIDENMSIIPVY